MNRREFLKILGLGMVAPLAVVAAKKPPGENIAVVNGPEYDDIPLVKAMREPNWADDELVKVTGVSGQTLDVQRAYLPFDGQYITDDETLAAYGLYRYRISPDGEWVVYD